jgi:hypothetical protein
MFTPTEFEWLKKMQEKFLFIGKFFKDILPQLSGEEDSLSNC